MKPFEPLLRALVSTISDRHEGEDYTTHTGDENVSHLDHCRANLKALRSKDAELEDLLRGLLDGSHTEKYVIEELNKRQA